MKYHPSLVRFFQTAILILGLMIAGDLSVRADHAYQPPAPQLVVADFLRAVYGRDAQAAYTLVAAVDQQVKTAKEYALETAAFDGPALILAQALASGIAFENVKADITGTRAGVTFDAVLPNANDPAVDNLVLGFDRDRLAQLTPAQVQARAQKIQNMTQAGQLPVLRSRGETWNLVREFGQWRLSLNWAGAVEVSFQAMTFHDLGWEFTPTLDRVMAKHGETIHMAYRARNIGTKETTGKAKHIIGPGKDARHLEIVGCFCFLEQTLAPGEEVELPLVFRVDYDAPEKVRKFTVLYEFYPADKFPGGHPTGRVQG